MRVAAMPSGPEARRFVGRVVVALVAAAAAGSSFRLAEAYRLYDNGAADFVVGSAEAIRWAPAVWGPGAQLEWRREGQPEWETAFGAADGAGAVIETALAPWSSLPGADIRWTLAETTAPAVGRWNRDSSSQVFFSAGGIDGAGVWFSRSEARQVWEISECDVALPSWWAEEGQFDADTLERFVIVTLREAFGDCLGLGPSAEPPTTPVLRTEEPEADDFSAQQGGFWTGAWVENLLWDPQYDRGVGASLLRPRPGWRDTVGTISGALLTDGEPLPYAHVWAFRTGEGSLADPVGAFSNGAGEFLIEGLAPGRYLLWGHPIEADYHRLLGAGGRIDVSDAVRMLPVVVTAGEVTDGITLTLRPNRTE